MRNTLIAGIEGNIVRNYATCLLLVGATACVLLPQRVFAQANVSTALRNANGNLCNIPAPTLPSGTPTSMAWVQSANNPGCQLFVSAFSYVGVIGSRARAEHHSLNGPSASFEVLANSSWTDSAIPTFAQAFISDASVDRLRVRYNFGATGSVAATGVGVGAGYASLGYDFNVAGQGFSGTQFFNGYDGQNFASPNFNTVSGTFELASLGIVNGLLTFNPFSLVMSSNAYAGAGRVFSGGPADGVADADFGSTLIWGGVSSVEALDAFGNVIEIPQGAFNGFIGQLTGFDYRYAAEREPNTTVTPEPATVVLLGVGLMALLLVRRRRVM